jgi:hypothetical protein
MNLRASQGFPGENWSNYQCGCNSKQNICSGVLNKQYIQTLNWNPITDLLRGGQLGAMMGLTETMTDLKEDTIEDMHLVAFAAKANADDNPTWEEAMNGPNKEGYWQACVKEIETLTTSKDAWEVLTREKWMNVLPITWAFKCKRYPDGLVQKLKARFCAGGHRQVEGRDYFVTFAPVVTWQTVRIMLILSLILNLSTKQVD